MSPLTAEPLPDQARRMMQERRERSYATDWSDDARRGSGLPLKTLAVLALGSLSRSTWVPTLSAT
jgi:hypothetical protein